MSRDPRDWQEDMDMCEEATTGPWKVYQVGKETLIGTEYEHPQLHAPDSIVGHAYSVDGELVYIRDKDAQLLAESREALPYWLQQYDIELRGRIRWAEVAKGLESDLAAEKERADQAELLIDNLGGGDRYKYIRHVRKELENEINLLVEHIIEVEKREDKLKEALRYDLELFVMLGSYPRVNELKEQLATLYPLEREDTNDKG